MFLWRRYFRCDFVIIIIIIIIIISVTNLQLFSSFQRVRVSDQAVFLTIY